MRATAYPEILTNGNGLKVGRHSLTGPFRCQDLTGDEDLLSVSHPKGAELCIQ